MFFGLKNFFKFFILVSTVKVLEVYSTKKNNPDKFFYTLKSAAKCLCFLHCFHIPQRPSSMCIYHTFFKGCIQHCSVFIYLDAIDENGNVLRTTKLSIICVNLFCIIIPIKLKGKGT
jgi:hypothetical protein